VARKEFLHIIRDPRSLGMGIAIPMMLLVLFGFALSLDVDRVPVLIWDQSRTPASRDLISRFQGSRYFEVKRFVDGYPAIDRAIDTAAGLTFMALVIPGDFATRLGSERPPAVQIAVDGSDANTAGIVLDYATRITADFSDQVLLTEQADLSGRKPVPPWSWPPGPGSTPISKAAPIICRGSSPSWSC
nr:ABC transporter permease [Desulfobacteraceae bacterium]